MSSSPVAARPRVVLLTLPTLFGAEIINRLADEQGIELVGVGLSVRLSQKEGQLAAVRSMLLRTGVRYMFANLCEADLAWSWLRLTRRPWGLKRVTGRVRPVESVNSPATLDWLRSLSPDFIVSFYFNQWIGDAVCTIPTRGCINVHPSLLPALRGPDPAFRAIQRGLSQTAITIHEVAKELDAGRILHQEPCDVPPGVSRFGLFHKLIRGGADLVARWLAGQVAERPPDINGVAPAGDYSTYPTPIEVNEFIRQGHRLVRFGEWSRALSKVR